MSFSFIKYPKITALLPFSPLRPQPCLCCETPVLPAFLGRGAGGTTGSHSEEFCPQNCQKILLLDVRMGEGKEPAQATRPPRTPQNTCKTHGRLLTV